jgi:hypothetical protein
MRISTDRLNAVTGGRRAYDMRERCPVAHSEYMGWWLFRHCDVVDVLADPTRYPSNGLVAFPLRFA